VDKAFFGSFIPKPLSEYPDVPVNKNHVFLDNTYPSIVRDSWVVLKDEDEARAYQVSKATEVSKSDFTLSAKVKEGSEEHDLKENDEVESFLFSWIFGFGVHAGPVTIEARYDLGLTNIAKDDEDTVKARTFSVLFGFGF